MNPLLKEVRYNPMLWLLAFVPVVFAADKLKPEAHTLLFMLSVLAIVPLAALLSLPPNQLSANSHELLPDARTPGLAGRATQEMEAVGEIERPKNARG